ncbi:MAG: lipid A biosynthesis acyltransferase [Sphingobacteriales bacterium]|nr:MAG: lipid A biosynthesis acyltransferase [Sphingobacteriales bacterium]
MYYLLLAIFYPISLLPFPALYLLSDFVYFLLYYMIGYRKELVAESLLYAFPEKNAGELEQIRKRCYHNFCDQWLETVKLLSISDKELNRRMTGNWEVFARLNSAEKNTYALLGHTFNWEWANVVCQLNAQQQFAGVYLPATDKAFDRLLQKIRTRSGAWLISMHAKKGMARLQQVRYIMGLIADQNPSNLNNVYWTDFMNREAPFFKGTELLASRNKAAVVFAGIHRVKRGYYDVKLEHITDDASLLPQNTILQQYVTFMERQVRNQPENWMWTHNRWKYKRNDLQ